MSSAVYYMQAKELLTRIESEALGVGADSDHYICKAVWDVLVIKLASMMQNQAELESENLKYLSVFGPCKNGLTSEELQEREIDMANLNYHRTD